MPQVSAEIIALLQKGVSGIVLLLKLLDRLLLEVPVRIIGRHPLFTKLRHADPSDRTLLEASMRETHGAMYWASVFLEREGDGVVVYAVDGHQRILAAEANGEETIIVQYFLRWTTVEAALSDAVSAQWARYEAVEADVVSLIRTGKMTQAELARKTGLGESTVSRLAKVAKPELEWLYSATQRGILPLGMAGKLVDATNDNREKLVALRNTFEDRFADAEAERKHWENHMKAHKRNWDRKTKEKARITTYFKGVDWSTWIDALEADEGVEQVDGRLLLKLDPDAGQVKAGVRIGDAKEWQDEIAVYGLFGSKREEIDPQDIDAILADWDHIRACLIAVRNGKPVPSLNPVKRISAPAAPQPQEPAMDVKEPAEDTQ